MILVLVLIGYATLGLTCATWVGLNRIPPPGDMELMVVIVLWPLWLVAHKIRRWTWRKR